MNGEEQSVKDPVCGMKLDQKRIKESLVYKERRYFFCSVGCRAEFQRHPEDYGERTQAEEGNPKDV